MFETGQLIFFLSHLVAQWHLLLQSISSLLFGLFVASYKKTPCFSLQVQTHFAFGSGAAVRRNCKTCRLQGSL